MEMIGAASLLRMMPKGYEEACFSTKAITRKREIKDPNDLMILVLFHLLTGCSLIEVSEISKLAKLGDLSDVAFMKRFSKCNEWFKWILTSLQDDNQTVISYDIPKKLQNYRILAVDASDVAEKGRSGRIFRLHFALDIANMHAAMYKITSNSVGEHLRNFELKQNDLVLADRVYSSISGIEYCDDCNCQYVARMRVNSFKPYDAEGNPIDLLEYMQATQSGDINVYARKERGANAGKLYPVRICFERKPADALDSTRKKMKRKESKKQLSISSTTYAFNEFLVVSTSLDSSITSKEILDLYRYRWQVELYFKRLKSILNYGELPKKSEESIFSWLNGKLMIALLIEKMISKAISPPWPEGDEEYMARDEDSKIAVANQFN